jgi:peroxiredoxin
MEIHNSVDAPDWSSIPTPTDDGAAVAHLEGLPVPSCWLASTTAAAGERVNLATLPGRTVVYAYPRTGQPGVPNPEGWDMIPGARGCSPQSCAFRDHAQELAQLGADHLFGLSTQSTEYQAEAAQRLHLPFALLSDEHLELCHSLNLPKMVVADMVLLQRCTMIIDDGQITKVFYPVFPPDENAQIVADWMRSDQG